MTTTEVNDVVGNVFVKKRGDKTRIFFKQKNSFLRENDNNFDGKLNDINYKKTFMQLYDSG